MASASPLAPRALALIALAASSAVLAGCAGDEPNQSAPGISASPSEQPASSPETSAPAGDGSGTPSGDDLASQELAIGWTDAVGIATEAFDGRLVSLELDSDDGRLAYSVGLASATDEFEAVIDPTSGEILREERDRMDEDDAQEVDGEAFELHGLISPAEAMTIATDEVPGAVRSWSFDRSWGGIMFDVEVSAADDDREVSIDATTGKVTEIDD